jgi:hypothetical protein
MAEYVLDRDSVARLIFRLLPHKPPYRLTTDRTNWKFGETNINILTLTVHLELHTDTTFNSSKLIECSIIAPLS